MKKILIMLNNDAHSGLVQSQILGKVVYFSKNRKVVLAVYKKNNHINSRYLSEIIYYSSFKELKSQIHKYDEIYFRDITIFLKLFLNCIFKRIKIIYDFRALVSYESYFRNKSITRFILLFLAEGIAYKLSNNVHSVSKNLSEKLHFYYGKKDINVIPSLIFTCEKKTSEIGDIIKFVYVGNLSEWQELDMIIETSIKIEEKLPSKFTFITKDKLKLEKMIKKTILKNFIVKSGDHNFVINELKKQDFGFLFRKDAIVNKVASPIKFLEYLSVGIVPILTPYVGDYSLDVTKNEIGIIFDNDEDHLIKEIIKISNNIHDIRERIYNYAIKRTWENFQ